MDLNMGRKRLGSGGLRVKFGETVCSIELSSKCKIQIKYVWRELPI